METKVCLFNEQPISFTLENNHRMMINATEMAKLFGKQVKHFNENESTEKFIQACLISRNSDLLGVKTREDLIISRKNSGTWMHRILALKFAAWLNPEFEVWVYTTIDELMFGSYKEDEKSLKEIARIQSKITQKEKFLNEHPLQQEIEELRKAEKKEKSKLELRKKSRISNYRTMFTEEEMVGEENTDGSSD